MDVTPEIVVDASPVDVTPEIVLDALICGCHS